MTQTAQQWRDAQGPIQDAQTAALARIEASLARVEGKLDDHGVRLATLLDGQSSIEQGQTALAVNLGEVLADVEQLLEQGQQDPPPPPPGKTLFGAFAGMLKFPNSNPTELKADMRSRVNTALGPLAVERIFNEGSWTVPASGTAAIVSFTQDPAAVARGDFDDQIKAFVQALDAATTYWLCLNHECDQSTRPYTPADQVAGFQHFSTVVRGIGKTNVKLATILMSWTLDQVGPDHWRDWYPGPDYVDALGWDCYWRPTLPHTAQDIYGTAYAVTLGEGKDFLVCETSIGAKGAGGWMDAARTIPVPEDVRTAFVTDAIAFLEGKAAAVTWFETNKVDGNWLLEGHPEALQLWKTAVAASLA